MSNTYLLNDTPIRTSVGYKMNDLTMKDLYLPEFKREFYNIETSYNNVTVKDVTVFKGLTYGVGKFLEESMSKYCNSSFAISSSEGEGDFLVNYLFDDENSELSNYIEINADKDMNVTVIFNSSTDKACYHNFIINTDVKNEAKVHLEIINLLNEESNHFISIENKVEDNSELEIVLVDMGAKHSVSNMYSNLVGKNSIIETNTIYIGQNESVKDINYLAHLRGKKCVADMDLQGVLDDSSKKYLKFTIDFKTGCTKASGSESESCMLLSDDVTYRSLPILLCTEDDVEGAHSAAAGQVDKGQLFYLMSRGIDKKEATKMLVKAKYNEIIEKLIDEELKKEVLAEVDRRL